jgi:CRP/FNR family transcriptional regulator, cyclic AMP receptor protein
MATDLVPDNDARFTPAQLRRIKLFADMTDEDIAVFGQVVEPVTCRPSQIIVRAGEDGDCMYLVMQGEFRVTLVSQGHEALLAKLEAGDFFGELCLLDQSNRSADVVAATPGQLLRFTRTAFQELVIAQPRVAARLMVGILRTVGSRLRKMDKQHSDSMLLSRSWKTIS